LSSWAELRYLNDVLWRYDIMPVSMVDLVWYIVGTKLLLFYGWDKLITAVDYAAKLFSVKSFSSG